MITLNWSSIQIQIPMTSYAKHTLLTDFSFCVGYIEEPYDSFIIGR